MEPDDLKRISGYAEAAMRLLRRAGIPPTPEFYELLYTYSSGTNPELNHRINEILKSGNKPDAGVAEALHREFLTGNTVEDRLDQVSSEIAERINTVRGAIEHAHASANSYSGLLQTASGDLAGGLTGEHLAQLTGKLLAETRKMQATNSSLEDRLDSARDHIATLQRELEQVRQETMFDPLTKIRNRKAFDRAIENYVRQATETGELFCLVLLDIDHFKAFNDNYGHQTGDQVLRLVANTLDTHTKDTDIAARYGGEEFGIILPGVALQEATVIAERLRIAVRSRELLKRSTRENLGKISASFGVAQHTNGDTTASIIERADKCLYAAKNNGRNQVVNQDGLAALTNGSPAPAGRRTAG